MRLFPGLACLLVATAMVSGCFTATGSLDASGAGRLTLVYAPPRHATVQSETKRFTSAYVRVESVGREDEQAKAVVTFDDVTKLSTAEAFRDLRVFREQDAEGGRLRIFLPAPEAEKRALLRKRAAAGSAGPQVTLDLPGRVLNAGPYGSAEDSRVTWQVPLEAYADEPWIELVVAYAHSM
jgi:hypothetical protein